MIYRRLQRIRTNPSKRLYHDDNASVSVELAIVLPVLLLCVFGLIDLGRLFFLYSNLNFAAAEGARVAAVTTRAARTTSGQIVTAVRASISDKQAAGATVVTQYIGTAPSLTVRVQVVNYPFTAVTPGLGWLVPGTKMLTATADVRYEMGEN